ncbi:MAG: hypothetical protein VKJ02_01365 [Snowella sp.]|nr:hypothetical protein [Snowella sp.]
MLAALYYPHVKMSKNLFKNALFLWDKIEYISPDNHFEPHYSDSELGEAVRSFSQKYIPTSDQKQQTNDAIIDLLKHPLPNWFFVKDVPDYLRYSVYTEKFSARTWERLCEEGLAEKINDEEFETSGAFGLTLMSILADFCAGTQKRLITDQNASYSALDRYLATIEGAELGKFDHESERLLTISLKMMNFKDVSLSRLVEIREKEKTASGAHIRELRHNYLRRIEDYADKLKESQNEQDTIEIERIFEQEMKSDLNLLQDELKDEAKKVFLSSEMATAVIALAGSFLEPTIGLTVAGGALYRKKVEYRASRNKTLKSHPMSWLYSMKKVQVV